jgi:hypothetical protein
LVLVEKMLNLAAKLGQIARSASLGFGWELDLVALPVVGYSRPAVEMNRPPV